MQTMLVFPLASAISNGYLHSSFFKTEVLIPRITKNLAK
ncbi:ankyrin repeat protein [Rickettsia prowazekii str. GvF12]|nr:ankyrin repeat protein [Rickettsia prowazekii str. GvF12]